MLINTQILTASWNQNVGRPLPNPESSVGFAFDTLEYTEPKDMAGPAGETFVSSAKPQDSETAQHVHSVVAGVERESSRIRALDGVEGQDSKDGPSVSSPAGATESYSWEPDYLDWSGGRRSFSLNDGKGNLYEYAKLDSGQEVYATKSGDAPANFVIFDSEQESYLAFSGSELQETRPNDGLIGG